MITHTNDSHQIPSQNNTKSKLQIFKKLPKLQILHETHLLKLLDKIYKYEMDPTRTVEATERTRDAGRTQDGRTDGQTDGRSETNIPHNNFVVRYNNGKLRTKILHKLLGIYCSHYDYTFGQNISSLGDICMYVYIYMHFSLLSQRFGCDFINAVFNFILLTGISSSYDNVFKWMPH